MQGAGNDFVVLDGIRQTIDPNSAFIRYLADRRFGIGADQVLLVEKSHIDGVDFKYRIFNCDGGEVEQCGNGARCFAVFVHEVGLTDKKVIRVETMKTIIEPEIKDDGRVTVNMGVPKHHPQDLPFVPGHLKTYQEGNSRMYCALLKNKEVWFSTVSMGNPHAVIRVEDIDVAPVTEVGSELECFASFLARVNVGFLEVLSPQHGKIRVWERGAGETLACGTGACAAAVEGIKRGFFENEVTLEARGGQLTIHWEGLTNPNAPVYLTGPAQTVFNGEITIPKGISHD